VIATKAVPDEVGVRFGRLAMVKSRDYQAFLLTDTGILIVLALIKLILHTLTNGNYGFHRDELAMIDDSRYLAWGYVAYPPLTPLIARVAFTLFGPSFAGLRLFAPLAQSIVMVLSGLIARELGGRPPSFI
jgi:4-amino-4-deoxy-L-arabinose transferase-like glycosyltransferase